jgi:hypothetical protein
MKTLIISAVIMLSFLLQIVINGYTKTFYFDPSNALNEPWRFITSMFLHGDFLHIFFNLYALILFGTILERKTGSSNFLKIFFLSGIVGNIFYYITVLLSITPPTPALGASGGVYGILAACAVFFPQMIIYIWFFPLRMKEAVVFWVITEFIGTFNVNSGIASAAHLGGLIAGYLYAKHLIKHSYDDWWMKIALK